jgi:C-terminal processing protease CtpA/Prc
MLYGQADTFTVSYTSADEGVDTASLLGITAKEIILVNEKLSAQPGLVIDKAASIAYMDINSFESYSKKPHSEYFWNFLEKSFHKINQSNIESLIIDLRDNPGGMIYNAHLLLNYISPSNIESAFQIKSSYLLKENRSQGLLGFLQRNFDRQSYAAKIAHTPVGRFIPFSSKSHFIANEKLKFRGKVYLLVNGNTFSAAGLFTKYFKEHHLGTVVGEECGSSPSFSFGNTLLINLPNTGVQVYLPTAIVSNDVLHQYYNRGIMPDVDICRNVAAEAKNEDSVLKQVYELIQQNHSPLITSNSK